MRAIATKFDAKSWRIKLLSGILNLPGDICLPSNLLCFWARVTTLHYIIRLMVGMWNIKRLLPFLYGLKLTSQERERILYESNESVSHESMSQIWKNNIFGRNNKIKHYFYYYVYFLHCCLHVQGLFLTWNLNLGCLLAVFQDLPLLLRAWPEE